jgi:N-glycosylase/DNA lyase
MEELTEAVEKLKSSEVKEIVDRRIKEFENVGNSSNESIFSELCFCIMTANFNAERSIMIQNNIKTGFCNLEESELAEKLSKLGHRFPSARAKYITEARKHKDILRELMNSFDNHAELREWLADNVKGLGYKEASHFLRNIGFRDLAIIDFHIVDLLVRYGLIEKPKTMTRKKYVEIEEVLKGLAEQSNLSLAELDLYLWYMETGKILK